MKNVVILLTVQVKVIKCNFYTLNYLTQFKRVKLFTERIEVLFITCSVYLSVPMSSWYLIAIASASQAGGQIPIPEGGTQNLMLMVTVLSPKLVIETLSGVESSKGKRESMYA